MTKRNETALPSDDRSSSTLLLRSCSRCRAERIDCGHGDLATCPSAERTLDINSDAQQNLMAVCGELRAAVERAVRDMLVLGMDADDVGEAINETVVQADWGVGG